MLKSYKILAVVGDIWNQEQFDAVLINLNKAIHKLSEIDSTTEKIIRNLSTLNFNEKQELEEYDFEILLNPSSIEVIHSLKFDRYKTILITFAGIITNPFGQWILKDKLFDCSEIAHAILDNRVYVSTMEPCEDWQSICRKHSDKIELRTYKYETENEISDELTSQISWIFGPELTNQLRAQLDLSEGNIFTSINPAHHVLNVSLPTICVFYDQGSPVPPCLITMQGFNMLINSGYGPRPQCFNELSFCQQVDINMLTHVSYNNIMSFSMTATKDKMPVPTNHLFLPCGIPVPGLSSSLNVSRSSLNQSDDVASHYTSNPLLIDLKTELHRAIAQYKQWETPHTPIMLKGRVPTSFSTNLVKPIQLYQKIGYGILELYPLGPFDEDPELKKFTEDWKKGKYPSDLSSRSLPSSLSFLLVWKPYKSKEFVKRLLYIGSKANVKRLFPSVIAPGLYTTLDFLKQMKYSKDSGVKKPRPRPNTADVRRNSATTTTVKQRPQTAAAGAGDVPNANDQKTNIKTSKFQPKLKTSTTTKPTTNKERKTDQLPSAASETAASARANKRAIVDSSGTKQPQNNTKQLKSTTANKPAINPPTTAHSNGRPATARSTLPNGNQKAKPSDKPTKSSAKTTQVAASSTHRKEDVVNETPSTYPVTMTDVTGTTNTNPIQQMSTNNAAQPQILAVGTVECAITEHGEADFCDDTPEELSIDQMRQMGLYDDNDNNGVLTPPTTIPPSTNGTQPDGTNLAELSMEGSIYNKEIFDNEDEDLQTQPHQPMNRQHWDTEPLALPPPPPANKKLTSSSASNLPLAHQICVDSLFLPSDLDKEDYRAIFGSVQQSTVLLQLGRAPALQLPEIMETLLSMKKPDSVDCTVIPSVETDCSLRWINENATRLSKAGINISTSLSNCSILINNITNGDNAVNTSEGDSPNSLCTGLKWEL